MKTHYSQSRVVFFAFIWAPVFVFLLTLTAFAQQRGLGISSPDARPRTALVIGNGEYANAPLRNPTNDARDMAQALLEIGFEVIYKENLNQNDMKRAIRALGEKLRAGGIGLFYFAGHGVQVKGQNYLIPVGATITSEEEVEYEAVDAGFILAQMEAALNPMNIVILDACRNNPFARSFRSGAQGLAQMEAPSGTWIAYATAPGSVASDGSGRNGLYTQELLRHMRTPGLSIEEVFKRVRISVRNSTQNKQTPWETSSLTGDFYFARLNTTVSSSDPQPSSATSNPTAIELTYWDSIKNSADPEDFKSYLRKYPAGEFADLAKRRAQAAEAKLKTSSTNTPENSPNSGKPRISEKNLSLALRINGLTTEELVEQIQQRGVSFQLTPEIEASLRGVGAKDEVINAVRKSYRPDPQ